MDDIDDRLTAALFRATCPDSMELGEYQLGLTSAEAAERIRQHVGICPHCTRELTQLEQYLTDLSSDVAYSTGDRIKIWIARLLPPTSPGDTAGYARPALALRGEEAGPLMYTAGETHLALEIREDPEQPGQKSLIGLVLGSELTDMEVSLWQTGERLTATTLSEVGNFVFSGLDPGDYELILSSPAVEIHVQALALT